MDELKFYINTKDGQSYITHNTQVVLSNKPTPIVHSPIGWIDTSIAFERDFDFWGILRNFATQYSFVEEAAKILRYIAYSKNEISKETYFLIQRLKTYVDPTKFNQTYYTIYKSLFDFSSFKDNPNRTVSVSFIESGLRRTLDQNKDTVYEIPLEKESEIQFVKTDGMAFDQSSKNIITDGSTMNTVGNHLVNIMSLNNEAITSINSLPVERRNFIDNTDLYKSNDFFLKTGEITTNVNIDFRIKFIVTLDSSQTASPFAQVWFTIRGFDESNNIQITQRVATAGTLGSYGLYNIWHDFSGKITITNVQRNTRLYLISTLTVNNAVYSLDDSKVVLWLYDNEVSYFNYNYLYRHTISYTKCITPYTLAKRLVTQMTGDETDLANSSLLNNNSGKLISPGNSLRGISNSKIKTNIKNIYKFCNVILGGCLGIEYKDNIKKDQIIIENYEYFLVSTLQHTIISDINDVSISYASDLVGNKLKIGYAEQNYSEVNGKMEYNNTALYSMPNNLSDNTIELICPFRADSYGIEGLRISKAEESTTDDKSDNEIFILDSVRSPLNLTVNIYADTFGSDKIIFISGNYLAIKELVPGVKFKLSGNTQNIKTLTITKVNKNVSNGVNVYVQEDLITELVSNVVFSAENLWELNRRTTVTEGVPAPETAFNVELSPAHLIHIHRKYINSINWGFVGSKMKFRTTEKNNALKSTFNGILYEENADYEITEDRLWLPWFINFNAKYPLELHDIMKSTPNRPFTFPLYGQMFKGILAKAALALPTDEPQEYRMLLQPNEPIEKLIEQ